MPSISTASAKRRKTTGREDVVCACRLTYPKLRFVPILRKGRHAQRLIVRILRYRVLVFRFDDAESSSSSRSGAGPQLLKCLFVCVLFGVELGQRGQGVTREASGDQTSQSQ